MMKCPQCGNELKIPNSAEGHLQTYGNPVMTRSECCGKGVTIRPVVTLEARAYTGDRTTDDWGNRIVPEKEEKGSVFVVVVNPPAGSSFVGPFSSKEKADKWILRNGVGNITWTIDTETPEDYLGGKRF